jgi:AraC-like DNA-binding protein
MPALGALQKARGGDAFEVVAISIDSDEDVDYAKRRLTESRDAIEEVAIQVGYRDRFFFSRDFKKLTGYSPREFRRREASQR